MGGNVSIPGKGYVGPWYDVLYNNRNSDWERMDDKSSVQLEFNLFLRDRGAKIETEPVVPKKNLVSRVVDLHHSDEIEEREILDIEEIVPYVRENLKNKGYSKINLDYEEMGDGRGQGEHVHRFYSIEGKNLKFFVNAWADSRADIYNTLDEMKQNLETVFGKDYKIGFNGNEVSITKYNPKQVELF